MRYSEARCRIRSGDLIFWRGKGLAAWVVRAITRSKWSHVGIAIWWGNRLMVADSYPLKGTRVRPLSLDIDGAYWLTSSANWRPAAHAFALDELGRKYSWQNLWKTWLGLALVKSEYHCAQYVTAVLRQAGVLLTEPPTPESIAYELSNNQMLVAPVELSDCGKLRNRNNS